MATPAHVFSEIAARHGIDPFDDEAVDRFYVDSVPEFSPRKRQAIYDELRARDGEQPAAKETKNNESHSS